MRSTKDSRTSTTNGKLSAFRLLNTVIEIRYPLEKPMPGGSKLPCKKKRNPLDEYKTRVTGMIEEIQETSGQENKLSLDKD